jgi:hypothetical protein
MTDLVPVTFNVFAAYWSQCGLERAQIISELYAKRWGGINVTATPTEVKGEFRVSGLFPREFAEAREYK